MQRFIYKLRENKWNMKNKDIDVLCELLKNGRISDRELAKKLNMSQSTVTRTRHRLEKKEILSYAAIPNLPSLGINLLVFTFAKCTKSTQQTIKKFKSFIMKNPKVIFGGEGTGIGKTHIIATLHNNLSDYINFIRLFRAESKDCVEDIESFFISTTDFPLHFGIGRAVESILKKTKLKKEGRN